MVGAGLNEHHRTVVVLTEPGGQHATRGASTDDDSVKSHPGDDSCRSWQRFCAYHRQRAGVGWGRTPDMEA